MFQFQRWQIVTALRRYLDAGGQTIAPQVLDDLQLTLPVGNAVSDSPYGSLFQSCMNGRQAASVALKFGYAGVTAAPNVVLQILEVEIANDDAAATMLFVGRMLTAAQLAALTTAPTSSTMTATANPPIGTKVASTIFQAADAATNGTGLIQAISVPAGQTYRLVFPKPGICLWGTAPVSGELTPSFAIVGQTLAQTFRATFKCREWPLAP